MSSTTDFDSWLSNWVDGNDHNDVHCLYSAVENVEDMGGYSCELGPRDGTWLVKATHADENLFLASISAKNAFLTALHDYSVGPDDDMDIDSWHHMHRAMEKDNS
ncbi:Uncharacterised protein [Morganella morganii]|uniref:hypothetical protein n=1 Tax=Morganella morganii TaxID=582 RepID=UPI000DA3B2A5|nr:hypothetical protein [Morganella morganii]SQL23919.1 Uncharacterised protein [Morganella morganii]